MKVNTYVENMRTPALPGVPLSNAFYFKEGGVLGAHPLRKHPQSVFASEKRKENERKRELVQQASQNFNKSKLKTSGYKVLLGYYIPPKQ